MATLDSLKPGQSARIAGIEGQDGVAMRLMEMGLIDGEAIQLIGYAPFGDPIEFEVRGYRVSLRSTEAQRVVIEPVDSESDDTQSADSAVKP